MTRPRVALRLQRKGERAASQVGSHSRVAVTATALRAVMMTTTTTKTTTTTMWQCYHCCCSLHLSQSLREMQWMRVHAYVLRTALAWLLGDSAEMRSQLRAGPLRLLPLKPKGAKGVTKRRGREG